MIDDDSSLLSVLSMSIESGGFEVIPLTTSDEAYVLLKKFTPDIILCDVNLETSTMGGFTFFEKVQEIEHLKQVPFIFLTGLSDDVLIRTGKEMGVDDYLTKPIKENLLAALRGKLKRFEQLKRTQPLEVRDPVAAFPRVEIHL
jgi:DNA-binding response OmpR family regulator